MRLTSSPMAVSMMMGMRDLRRICWQMVMPSMSGRRRSRRMRSGLASSISLKALLAVGRADGFEAMVVQLLADHLADRKLIIHHQHERLLDAHRLSLSSTPSGFENIERLLGGTTGRIPAIRPPVCGPPGTSPN